jgi:hypothetical protein
MTFQYPDYIVSCGRMTDEQRWIGRDLEESGLIEVLCRHSPRGIEEDHKKYQSVKPVSQTTEIQTEHFSNTSLESYLEIMCSVPNQVFGKSNKH